MARLILKCRYIKAGEKHSKNLIKYIATRDGVEKNNESWKNEKAAQAQIELINEIACEFPETVNSIEYKNYLQSPNKGTASRFISYAIDENVDKIDTLQNYIGYIAKCPRVERIGTHGLFSDSDTPINLSEVAKEVSQHNGIVWTDIVSIRREDAVRLNYDNAKAWRSLIRSQTAAMAESMKIPLQDLRWYAAFHNESYHPHVHIVAYSAGREPYMTEKGIEKLKSSFAREIFKQDLIQIYEKQTEFRNDTVRKSRDIFSKIVSDINSGTFENRTIALMFEKLAEQLSDYKGKKVYGYLPRKAKNLVNGIVDEAEKDKRIASLYNLWYEQRGKVLKTYTDTTPNRIPLSQNKEFRSIKNAVIKEALNIIQKADNFEAETVKPDSGDLESGSKLLFDTAEETDRSDKQHTGDEKEKTEFEGSPKSLLFGEEEEQGSEQAIMPYSIIAPSRLCDDELAVLRLFAYITQLFRDSIQADGRKMADKKLRRKINDKKKAQGLKLE